MSRTHYCRLECERLEDRSLLDATIFNQGGLLVQVRSDGVPIINGLGGAAPIAIKRDGVVVATGDQLVFLADVTGRATDFREYFVIDTNGVFRIGHFDISAAPGSEDPFGTSGKLPPGLITDNGAGGANFFLAAEVQSINLITTDAGAAEFRLEMTGRPADGATAQPHNTLPVLMQWTVTLLPPSGETTVARIDTTATFQQALTLSASHMTNAEAFRAFEFTSSNVPDANTTPPLPATHDTDQLRITDATGAQVASVDLTAQAANMLFFGGGLSLSGRVDLNQLNPAPLNSDPPNVSAAMLAAADNPAYRVQGFKTVNGTVNENSDNVGVWFSRTLASAAIANGMSFAWSVDVTAADDVINPANSDLFTDLGANGIWRWTASGGLSQISAANPENLAPTGTGDLFADLGASGLWRWTSASGWQLLASVNPDGMTVAGNGDLFADFGSYATHRWTPTTGWQQLGTVNPDRLIALPTAGNGDLFADLGSYGLWRWNATGWRQLATVDPQALTVAPTGEVYAGFGSFGAFRWTFAGWRQIATVNPENLVAAGNGDLFADPGSFGLQRWTSVAGWQPLSPVNPENVVVAGNGDAYVDFGPNGLWRWTAATGFQALSGLNPDNLAVAPNGDLFADLAAFGLWRWTLSTGLQQLSTANPDNVATARNARVYSN